MSNLRSFVTVDDVETQSFDWGKLQWLTDPRVTGSQCMVSGIVTLDPGQGHARHITQAVAKICSSLKVKENK